MRSAVTPHASGTGIVELRGRLANCLAGIPARRTLNLREGPHTSRSVTDAPQDPIEQSSGGGSVLAHVLGAVQPPRSQSMMIRRRPSCSIARLCKPVPVAFLVRVATAPDGRTARTRRRSAAR